MRKIVIIVLALLWTMPASAQSQPQIISFSYDGIPLIYDEVEQGIATADFSWEAVNVAAPYRTQMHAFVGGQWVLIGDDFEPSKHESLVIAHPLSFSDPTYRLSIVDGENHIVDEELLQLPYAETDPDGAVQIVDFETTATAVSRQGLISGSEVVDVSWVVNNRTASTNLIFEQVLSDGTWQSIELPRFEDWVRSVGDGMVVPVNVVGEDHVTLQLRVVDIVTGETLTTQQIELAITDGGGQTVSTQAPTSTPIQNFQRDQIQMNTPYLVTLGGTMTLSWDASAAAAVADEVVIREWHRISYTGRYGEIPFYIDNPSDVPANEWNSLPLTGEITVDAPSDFPTSSLSYRDVQNAIIIGLYLRNDGQDLIDDTLAEGQRFYLGYTVYLRTAQQATNCTPTVSVPSEVPEGEVFSVSWDFCGVPDVQVEFSPNEGQVTDYVFPASMPALNPGSRDYRVGLFPDQSHLDVTFVASNIQMGMRAEGTVRVVRP